MKDILEEAKCPIRNNCIETCGKNYSECKIWQNYIEHSIVQEDLHRGIMFY